MQIKTTFLLIVILFSLAASSASQFGFTFNEDCCTQKSAVKGCFNNTPKEKKSCKSDHCNPFKSCSTTGVLISQVFQLKNIFFVNLDNNTHFYACTLFDFYPKYWHPPKTTIS